MEDIEDYELNDAVHNRLVSAVSKLDKTQHIKEPTRNEPTNLKTEFNLIKNTNRLDLGNVVKVLENTASHVEISKKLKRTQDSEAILPKPLEKPQAERIKRATGYGETKKKIGRWDPVVARNRTVDLVTLPLKKEPNKLQSTNEFLSKLKLKSPLEQELEEIDPSQFLEEEDEEPAYPVSYHEMVSHRQHLAKLRAQQSFNAAKAKRQSKIKSKKYHRILKKERLKQELKEFEELQKTDPEEALKKLELLEKSRALERHTLRHKNTGKWAKSKLIRAKYDKDVRQELAEQLAVGRGLSQKVPNEESSEEEDNVNIPDVTLSQDPMNPWMLKKGGQSNVDAEFDFGYKKYLNDRMLKRKANSDSDSEPEEKQPESENRSLASIILKDAVNNISADKVEDIEEGEATVPLNLNNKEEVKKRKPVTKKIKLSKTKKLVATSKWLVESLDSNDTKIVKNPDEIADVFESLESKIMGKVQKKIKQLKRNINRFDKKTLEVKDDENEEEIDSFEYLKMKNQKIKPIIDEKLNESSSKKIEDLPEKRSLKSILEAPEVPNKQNAVANVDPSGFITAKPKYLVSAVPKAENDIDLLDDDEQVVPKVSIEEAFEEDDMVASFRKEKEDEINKDLPKDIGLSLPGWGSWGGKGIKPAKRKRSRFILKAPPVMPRRDENKGDIIIKEYTDPKLASHKVTDVPFPFTSVKEYEASIRTPLGNTFIPEKAHKKLIRPNVITKVGAIIEPMDEDELLVSRNRTYQNKNVIRFLAKK